MEQTERAPTFIAAAGNAVARAVRASDGGWAVESSLQGEAVRCLAADPLRPNIVYAGTEQRGVWRSDDAGVNWEQGGLRGKSIRALAVDPHDPDTVYAGAKPAVLFVSRDGGRTWTEMDGFRRIPNRWWWFSPAEPPDIRPYVLAVAPSPTEPGVLLAGVEFGAVVRSEDGGRTWSGHRHGALRDCHALCFHAVDGVRVYEAGGTGGGAACSRDGGRTFVRPRRGLAKHYGVCCAADPGDPDVWYVCVAPGPGNAYGSHPEIYLYRASGDDWQPIGWAGHPLPVLPKALVTRPDAPGHLYAGLADGDVWHTADYGDTWARMPFNLERIRHSLLVL